MTMTNHAQAMQDKNRIPGDVGYVREVYPPIPHNSLIAAFTLPHLLPPLRHTPDGV